MIKIKKATFDKYSNRMRSVTNIEKAIYEFKQDKNKNLNFLLTKRFNWMKKFYLKMIKA